MMKNIKNLTISTFLAAAGLIAVGTISAPNAAAQSSTAGALRGIIRDSANGKPLAGATVVITSPALQGDSLHITEDNGAYNGTNLPPGIYLVTVYYNDAEFSRTGIEVQVGKLAIVNFRIDTTKGEGEKIVIAGTTPLIDLGSSKTGSTISEEFTNNIPTGRTMASVLDTAGGSQGDSYGQSFYGSTSVESTYVVEGLNTTDTAYGGISTNLPNEFIDETEVITGGYAAEFGRSTGGVINVVTKRGSNEFKGSVFGYYTPGALQATATKIQREGSAISTESDLKYRWDLGAEVGGPIVKDKLWFHVGFNPSFYNDNQRRIISSYTDADDDGNNDIDPATGFSVLEEVGSERTPITTQTYYYTAKLSAALSEAHQAQLSFFGNPSFTDNNYRSLGAESSRLQSTKAGSYDTSLKWNSSFAEGKTQVEAVLGYHKAGPSQDPRTNAQAAPQVVFNAVPHSLEEFAQYEDIYSSRCTDGGPDDDYANIVNCPVSGYNVGGLGYIESANNDRFSAVASVSQRVEAAGTHTFKLGVDFEQTIYDADRGYTGAVRYSQRPNGNWRESTYLKSDPNGDVPCGVDLNGDDVLDSTCSVSDTIVAATKSEGMAAYLQDSWQITPGLSFNPGIRWEQQTGYAAESLVGTYTPEGEKVPSKAYELKNMFSPRLGLVYDPTEEGRSKFFAHWGRFYEAVPLDINVRAFGGELLQYRNIRTADCPGVQDTDPDHINVNPDFSGCDPVYDRSLGGGTEYVTPGMKGQYLNELVLGGEYEVAADFKIGATYIHRGLPRVIEDISTDGGSTYVITNPGENFDDQAADLDEQALALEEQAADPSLDPEEAALIAARAALYAQRADILRAVKQFDKPVRNYDALQITAQRRFSKNSLLLATYTYSKNVGNYPGLYSTETDQLDPNLTSLYDLPDLMANRYGELGLSRPHSLKVDGFYSFDLKAQGAVTLGGSFRAQSGLPINTLGSHVFYGGSEAFILPRGSEERSPTVWSTDIKVQYGRKVSKRNSVEVFADVFNLFDKQTETEVDQSYTTDSINPIVGGDADDLIHAKALDSDGLQAGVTPLLNPNFKNASARQAPRIFRFGVRVTF